MAYGLEIYNDSGFLQISDSVANYFMVYSGVAIIPPVTSLPTTPSFATTVSIEYSTPFDAVAVYSADRYVIPQSIRPSSVSSAVISCVPSLTQGTVRYWLFKKYSSLAPSTSGYGMEIYDSTGTVNFSTQNPKLMRSYSTIPITSLSGTQSFSLPTDRMIAFLTYGTSYTTAVAPTKASPDVKVPMAIQSYSGGVYVKSSTVRGGRVTNTSPVFTGGLVALDVTNY